MSGEQKGRTFGGTSHFQASKPGPINERKITGNNCHKVSCKSPNSNSTEVSAERNLQEYSIGPCGADLGPAFWVTDEKHKQLCSPLLCDFKSDASF